MSKKPEPKTRVQQPIKIHGGKGAFNGKLAQWIIDKMPSHSHYIEPFFGGGSVLLRKPAEGISETVNDLNGELINFWRCLQDRRKFGELKRILSVTPLARDEFERARGGLFTSPAEQAARFFVRCRQSRQGLQRDYCTPTKRTRRGMNEQASAWLSAIDGLRDVRDRMINVEVENLNALDLIEKRDHAGALFYCDPPYLPETRGSGGEYSAFEMSEGEHYRLLEVLSAIEGRFLLSGYHSDFYGAVAKREGWNLHEFEIANNAASGETKERKIECLWTNF